MDKLIAYKLIAIFIENLCILHYMGKFLMLLKIQEAIRSGFQTDNEQVFRIRSKNTGPTSLYYTLSTLFIYIIYAYAYICTLYSIYYLYIRG